MESFEPEHLHLYAERIVVAAEAVARFGRAFLEVDGVDTTQAERLRLAQADQHLQQALDCFS